MASGSNVEKDIVPERTVCVHGIPSGVLEDDIIEDLLMIHFQKSQNGGGDVEEVIYPTRVKGVAFVTFEDKKVAEEVLQKDVQILSDKRLPNSFALRVSRYGEHVFTCASAVLDLSVFCDEYVLEDLVKELQEKVTDLKFSSLTSEGQISVEGPFPAIKQLRDILLLTDPLAENGSDYLPAREWESSKEAPTPSMSEELGLRLDSSLSFRQECSIDSHFLILDTDVFLYMTHFSEKHFQEILNKYKVTYHTESDGDITTMWLKAVGAGSDAGKIENAKMAVQILSQKLQSVLRKERILLGDKRNEHQMIIDKCNSLKCQYSKVLVVPYSLYLDVIGTATDIYQFMEDMKETESRKKIVPGNYPQAVGESHYSVNGR